MVVVRNFQVNLGNTYPENIHKEALEMIARIETTEFKISTEGLTRGDITHGGIAISWPSAQARLPLFANVTVTFFDVNQEEDARTAGTPPNDLSVPKGGSDFKKRTLVVYPSPGQLKIKAENRGQP